MARRVKAGVQIASDLTSVAKFVGAGEAMVESIKDQNYLDAVISAAHGEAQQDFNMEVAAAAAAGANLKHMFEWGTAGINTGRSSIRPNPLSERARLWTEVLTGRGFNQTLTYVFKPSVAIVPKPTKRDTGMDTDVINNLRDHVFMAKAEVLETGSMVTIAPKNAEFLLIPYYPSQHGSLMFSDSDIERGFTLSKGPHTHSPGDTSGSTGQFTSFWTQFWEGRGAEMVNASVGRQIESDFFPSLTVNYSPNRPVIPVPGAFQRQVEKAKSIVKREAMIKARTRKRTR